MKITKSVGAVFGIFLTQLVSGYSSSIFGYYSSPVDMLINSEWIRFLLVFAIFYALIFYSIKNRFSEGKSKGPAVVISICISLLITIALAQQGLFYSFFGGDFSSWLIFLAVMVVLLFIISAAYSNFGPKFTAFVLLFIWCILAFYFNPSSWISYGSASDIANMLYSLWISLPGAIVTLIVVIALFFVKKDKKGFNIRPEK